MTDFWGNMDSLRSGQSRSILELRGNVPPTCAIHAEAMYDKVDSRRSNLAEMESSQPGYSMGHPVRSVHWSPARPNATLGERTTSIKAQLGGVGCYYMLIDRPGGDNCLVTIGRSG